MIVNSDDDNDDDEAQQANGYQNTSGGHLIKSTTQLVMQWSPGEISPRIN
jgi:hypothetical protein